MDENSNILGELVLVKDTSEFSIFTHGVGKDSYRSVITMFGNINRHIENSTKPCLHCIPGRITNDNNVIFLIAFSPLLHRRNDDFGPRVACANCTIDVEQTVELGKASD